MRKWIWVLIAFTFVACSRLEKFPDDAKLCGDYWISCTALKRGMYRCRIYSKLSKKLVKEQTYICPVFHKLVNDDGILSDKITKYDGSTIYLNDKRKLIACDIPEDATLIESVNGGVWVSYRPEDVQRKLYACTVYSMKDAGIVSTGSYVLKRFYWDRKAGKTRYVSLKEAPKYLEFVYYGGIGITLKKKMVLMPVGWIDYPGGGLRVLYDEEGNEVSRVE